MTSAVDIRDLNICFTGERTVSAVNGVKCMIRLVAYLL
jgi:hypothetical protein